MRFYVEDDFRPVKTGTLHVTNQRLLFVGDGTTSVRLDKVLQLGLEPRREGGECVGISIDGRKTPYYIDAPDPFVLTAYINRVQRG